MPPHSGLFYFPSISIWIHLICGLPVQTCGRWYRLVFLQEAFPDALWLLSCKAPWAPNVLLTPSSQITISLGCPCLAPSPTAKPLRVEAMSAQSPITPRPSRMPVPELGHKKQFLNEPTHQKMKDKITVFGARETLVQIQLSATLGSKWITVAVLAVLP